LLFRYECRKIIPRPYPTSSFRNLLNEWIGSDKKLVILDLNGVPFEVLDIIVGLITRFIYDSMFWGRNEIYTGKNRPLLLAYEEAHNYLNKSDNNSYSKNAVEKIFKEGRKFLHSTTSLFLYLSHEQNRTIAKTARYRMGRL